MKSFAKKLSCIGGVLAASALIASMMIAPAFAADPTYRSSTGQYTETVAYDSSVETASTEVLIDTKFHYLDYSPEIDVTYEWDEDLEWVFVKNGSLAPGFWVKGHDEASAFDYTQKRRGGTKNWTSFTDSNITSYDWEQYQEIFGVNDMGDTDFLLCVPIKFTNNASNKLYLSFEEQAMSKGATAISGKTYTAVSYSANSYLDYRAMCPVDSEAASHQWGSFSTTKYMWCNTPNDEKYITSSLLIGNDSSSFDSYRGDMPNNEYVVGVSPKPNFKPAEGSAWIAENRIASQFLSGKLKLIFTKSDA